MSVPLREVGERNELRAVVRVQDERRLGADDADERSLGTTEELVI